MSTKKVLKKMAKGLKKAPTFPYKKKKSFAAKK